MSISQETSHSKMTRQLQCVGAKARVLQRAWQLFARLGWAALLVPVLLATSGIGFAQRVLIVDIDDDVGNDLMAAAPTPNLDRVAAVGRTLTGLWSYPSCSPSRAQLQVGSYGLRVGNLIGAIVKSNANYILPATGPTLPRIVTNAGLRAGKVGKWHLSKEDDYHHPLQVGWQHYSGVPSNLGLSTYYSYVENVNGVSSMVNGEYLTTRETNQAIQLVLDGFELISLSYHAVHSPHHVPPAHLFTGMTPVTDFDKTVAALEALDHELGRLLSVAIPAGYTVLIASDNGTKKALGGGKGTLFESGIAVPCWAVGPQVLPGVDDALIGWVDLYATIADLLNIPLAAGEGVDSISFRGVLAGQPGTRLVNYSERWPINGLQPQTVAGIAWARAARDSRYKLIRNEGVGGDRFYDLLADPMEQDDLLGGALTATEHQRLQDLRSYLTDL